MFPYKITITQLCGQRKLVRNRHRRVEFHSGMRRHVDVVCRGRSLALRNKQISEIRGEYLLRVGDIVIWKDLRNHARMRWDSQISIKRTFTEIEEEDLAEGCEID